MGWMVSVIENRKCFCPNAQNRLKHPIHPIHPIQRFREHPAMSMFAAIQEAERLRVEIEARLTAKRDAQQAGEVTWRAMQELPARLIQQAAQERREAILRLLGDDHTAVAVACLVGASGGSWQGSPSALATAVGSELDAPRFGHHVRRIVRLLRLVGIRTEIGQTGIRGRYVKLDIFDASLFDKAISELKG